MWTSEEIKKPTCEKSQLREPKPVPSDTRTHSETPSPDTESIALPNQLPDSRQHSVNGWPTWCTESLLNNALFDRSESKGAVRPRGQRFGADGFLADQGGGGGGKHVVQEAPLIVGGLVVFLTTKEEGMDMYMKVNSVQDRKKNHHDESQLTLRWRTGWVRSSHRKTNGNIWPLTFTLTRMVKSELPVQHFIYTSTTERQCYATMAEDSSNLDAWQESLKRRPPEGHQRTDTEREAVVEERGVTTRSRTCRLILHLLWMLLQVGQLEAAAQQQVQELGLKDRQWVLYCYCILFICHVQLKIKYKYHTVCRYSLLGRVWP